MFVFLLQKGFAFVRVDFAFYLGRIGLKMNLQVHGRLAA